MSGNKKKKSSSNKGRPPNKSGKRPSESLETKPTEELVLDGKRYKEPATASLKLKNVSKAKVAYKVLCNHPFVIKLAPNVGFIEPSASVTITVTRLKFDSEKYDSQGRRTALLLQHVTVSEKADDVEKVWAHVMNGTSMKKRMPIKLMGADKRVLGESTKDDGGSATED